MKENWMESYTTETAVDEESEAPAEDLGSDPAVEQEDQPASALTDSISPEDYQKSRPEASTDPFSGR
jgi:hypothetical protein